MRVIGIGNPLRGDDAIGLLVARRVRELADPEVEVMELEGEPARLIDAWQGADLAVVVDAVKSGAPQGTVMRIDAAADPLPPSVSASSTHALGLGRRDRDRAGARPTARALGRIRDRGSGFVAGSDLSPAVAGAIEPVAEAVLRERERADAAPKA